MQQTSGVFYDVKNTPVSYMKFDIVNISHTIVRYWYKIRDVLVPICPVL